MSDLAHKDIIALAELQAEGYDVVDDDEFHSMLYEHYHHEMPYGTAKARTGDPYEWLADKLDEELKHFYKFGPGLPILPSR